MKNLPLWRLRLWHLMALIAVSGVILVGFMYLRTLEPINLHDMSVNVNGVSYMANEPGFWLITGFVLIVYLASITACAALLAWMARMVYRRFTRSR
jgi:hypothetical protein